MITETKCIKCVCERCGYGWMPLDGKPPKVCPKCKSHKWNVPKTKKDVM